MAAGLPSYLSAARTHSARRSTLPGCHVAYSAWGSRPLALA